MNSKFQVITWKLYALIWYCWGEMKLFFNISYPYHIIFLGMFFPSFFWYYSQVLGSGLNKLTILCPQRVKQMEPMHIAFCFMYVLIYWEITFSWVKTNKSKDCVRDSHHKPQSPNLWKHIGITYRYANPILLCNKKYGISIKLYLSYKASVLLEHELNMICTWFFNSTCNWVCNLWGVLNSQL